jgi:hypothetical protein
VLFAIVLTGVGLGVLIGVASAFFGAVIPSSVNNGADWEPPPKESTGIQ